MSKLMAGIDLGLRSTGVVLGCPKSEEPGYTPDGSWCFQTESQAKKHGVYVANDNVRCCREIVRAVSGVLSANDVKAVAVELPSSGAKSSRAMAAMALATGMIAALSEFTAVPFVWVRPSESKRLFGGSKTATKKDMIAKAQELYGDAAWLGMENARGRSTPPDSKAEHVADAWAALHVARDSNEYRMVLMMNEGNK